MRERIKQIMEAENLSPARFADNLNIGRAVISHILNGRNNPSLDVITRILSQMPDINSDWLLTGIPPMYKSDINNEQSNQTEAIPDLFSQIVAENSTNQHNVQGEPKYSKEKADNLTESNIQNVINEKIIYKEAPAKKIRQIIIYYTDNTFETFSGT